VCSSCILFHESRLLEYGNPRVVGDRYERLLWADRMAANALPRTLGPLHPPAVALKEPTNGSLAEIIPQATKDESQLLQSMEGDKVEEVKGRRPPPPGELISLEIHNEAGRPVVLLMIGQKYKLVVQVRFNEDVRRPNFGFCIQKENGLVITGDTTYENRIRIEARANTIVTVSFEFTCRILSGAYLIGCGVTDIQDNGDFRILLDNRALFSITVAGKPINGLFDPVCSITYDMTTAPWIRWGDILRRHDLAGRGDDQ
jgi:hypothetical protein